MKKTALGILMGLLLIFMLLPTVARAESVRDLTLSRKLWHLLSARGLPDWVHYDMDDDPAPTRLFYHQVQARVLKVRLLNPQDAINNYRYEIYDRTMMGEMLQYGIMLFKSPPYPQFVREYVKNNLSSGKTEREEIEIEGYPAASFLRYNYPGDVPVEARNWPEIKPDRVMDRYLLVNLGDRTLLVWCSISPSGVTIRAPGQEVPVKPLQLGYPRWAYLDYDIPRDEVVDTTRMLIALINQSGALAQGPQNPKLSVELGQVLANPNFLVESKPALILARVKWNNPGCPKLDTQITWIHNGVRGKPVDFTFKQAYPQSELNLCKDAYRAGFAPRAPRETDQIEVKVKGFTDEKGKPIVLKQSFEFPVKSPGNPCTIKLLFVPIDTGGFGAGGWPQQEIEPPLSFKPKYFDPFRQKQLDFMRGIFPLPAEAIVDCTQSGLLRRFEMTEQAYSETHREKYLVYLFTQLEAYWRELSRDPGRRVDVVVGVLPQNWMKDAGLTLTDYLANYPHVVILDEAAPTSVLAHEVGHLLGFEHNQDANGGEIKADRGYWVKSLAPLSFILKLPDEAGVSTVDFMDRDPLSAESTWISRQNYQLLFDRVSRRFGPSLGPR